MNTEELHFFLYKRVKEIQPHLLLLVKNYKEMGMNSDEINTEICFAIMHEGYRIRDLINGIEIKS